MDIRARKETNATVVTISGRLDAVTSPVVEKTLNEMIDGGETRFVADLAGLDYISSAGLRVLLAIAKFLKGKGGLICFANVAGAVREVFDISGFGTIFQMHDSVDGALCEIK
ncbi:MAG TPA: STAS domain-containing protein [Geobacteraceae bacterium]|nr:STAS domain-containing protein [Geobacteraceae bacterium]